MKFSIFRIASVDLSTSLQKLQDKTLKTNPAPDLRLTTPDSSLLLTFIVIAPLPKTVIFKASLYHSLRDDQLAHDAKPLLIQDLRLQTADYSPVAHRLLIKK